MAAKILRIFVSSPSDVAGERERVKLVADRLNGELEGLVRLEILRWEDAFYTAAHSFQEAIDSAVGNMSATDMVVCIVWKRAGLRLNPAIWQRGDGSAYESGTVLEVETAVSVSRAHSGVPDVYLFRKTADVLYRADRAVEEMEQHQLLEAIWKRWTESVEGYNTAGYQTFNDQDDFEDKLEACLRQWLERRGVVVRGPVWDRKLKGSPFRGLAHFDAAHAPVFFGRDATISRAIAKLRRAPFLLVIGASGSGKSSLLRAGLIPRVTAAGVIPDVDQWRTAIVLPADDPLLNLADALFHDGALGTELRAGDFSSPRLLAKLFEAGGEAAMAPIRSALGRASDSRMAALRYDERRPTRLLIAVDQVERLFVEAQTTRATAFAGVLRDLVVAGLASVVAVLRSDAYGRFQAIEPFLSLLEAHGGTLDLLPPSPAELEDIVTRPVAACHPPLAYETSDDGQTLAERLAADARGGDALPLLQMTLQRLFDAEELRGDGVLRFRDYPGMDAAVTRTAEEAVADLDPRALAALPALITSFVRDVTFDPAGRLETMSIVPVVRATFERGHPARAALVDQFIARRLLTAEEADGTVRVRPVHEAFLRVQPKAIAIIKENASLIRVRGTLEPMAAEWARAAADKKDDFLARSPALIAGAAQLNERFGEDLAPELRAFISASLAADARHRNAERNRQRRIIAATAAGLLIALALAGLAGWQWQVASEQQRIAEINAERAERSLAAATKAADALIFDLAQEFRGRQGMPIDLVRKILERVQQLQQQLAESGQTSPDLRLLQSVALDELATTFLAQGDHEAALKSAERANAMVSALVAEFPSDNRLKRSLALSLNKLGDVRAAQGAWDPALEFYRKALAIVETLVASDSNNTGLQRDLTVCYNKVADALAVSGKRDEAIATYRRALAITEALASKEPGSSRWQSDLSFTYNRIAIVLSDAGRNSEALEAYRKSLAVREAVAKREPDNADRKRDVFLNLSRMGDVLSRLGQHDAALENYRRALTIIEALTESDPRNQAWRRDLSVAHVQVGDQQAVAGHNEAALEAYRKSLNIRERLAAAQPDNVQWQRDVEVVHNKIGDILIALGQRDGAIETFRKALAIAEKLHALNRSNSDWQWDLAFVLIKLGDALAAADRAQAHEHYRKALPLREKLAADNPTHIGRQRDVTLLLDRLGDLAAGDDKHDEALAEFRRSLDIRVKLAAQRPDDIDWQRDVAISHAKIGTALAALKRSDEALAAFRASHATIEAYAATNPDYAPWQIDIVISLVRLAQAGDTPRLHFVRALEILRKLDAEKKLTSAHQGWISALEQAIANISN